ncbi:hypothetical protein [Sphingomonas bacterium]|uniref:hypothetical protein n=1 Tax=Sphingomonas bacterium TaxID=1895847 RepID=UPI001575FC54|nr:hypothetical protein [Sphingomonas bacterium]
MKTHPTPWLRRLAVIVGTLFVASQASANAVAPAQPPQQAQVPAAQPHMLLATLTCTRVGTRMVC